jgi:hypothetical protein
MHCCDPRRLEVLRAGGTDNAIEFVEVLDRAAPPGVPRQRTLFVRLLRAGFALTPGNLRIDGGERIRSVGIVWAGAGDALPPQAEPALAALLDEPARTLVIRTDSEGDYSRYTLWIVADLDTDTPPAGFDPILSTIAFSFKVECPSDFDCGEIRTCPPEEHERPPIDYLAKDYPGFRRLMLDRMALLAPGWTERSAADIGVTLVELLAYAADNLSYRQDAVANEAYLNTARKRVSVRRHARLVDYHVHDGCNARAGVQVQVEGAGVVIARGTPLFTRTEGVDVALIPGSLDERRARGLEGRQRAEVFETAVTATLDASCNEIPFYTWGDAGCCLPVGSTSATLRGRPLLAVGDVLVFEEVASPTTFAPADADRARRWAVRLTSVLQDADPSGQLFDTPPINAPVEITRVAWDRADALPFALCLSVRERPGLAVSIARGNIVLADHGDTLGRADDEREDLGHVPPDTRRYAPQPRNADRCKREEAGVVPVRYRPALKEAPVTHGFDLVALLMPLPDDEQPFWPASLLLPLDVRAARPQVWLRSVIDAQTDNWNAVRDLLGSSETATEFVVETEHDGH